MPKKSSVSSQLGKRRKEKESEWVLSPEARARLKALEAMPDSEIDFSDIPEITDFTGWTVGTHYRPWKKAISFRVDIDVLSYFQMMGKRYQTRMNQALREYMNMKLRERDLIELADVSDVDDEASPSVPKVKVKLKKRAVKKKKTRTRASVPTRSKLKKIKRKKSPRK